jgi:Ca2+-binding RTX toxin-like protein
MGGDAGNDFLDGDAGNDTMDGGADDDYLRSSDFLTADTVDGGDGFDTADSDGADFVSNCEA